MKRFWKQVLAFLLMVTFCLVAAGPSYAILTTIGVANFDFDGDGVEDGAYNLIYEGLLGGSGLVWLDYTNRIDTWQNQVNWAASLGDSLTTVTIDPAYSTSIDFSTGWRLPTTVDGPRVLGYDGTTTAGYNITTSEMGHLYYGELGNLGRYDTSGSERPAGSWGLTNTDDFHNLVADWYWSSTVYGDDPDDIAWCFSLYDGFQSTGVWAFEFHGLAVHSGQVSNTAPVPEPSTMLLLGTGILGIAGLGRKKFLKNYSHKI